MNRVDRLSWDAVEARIAAGTLALLPVGAGAKQHGLHLPMGTDRIQAEWLCDRLAERLDALVWPTLTYGFYPAFVGYAGSTSLSAPTFEAQIRETVLGLVAYGTPVLVLDTGISTNVPVNRALTGIDATLHLPIHAGPRYRAAALRVARQAHGGHADELETSRMLAIAPELVAMARAEAGPDLPPGPGPMQHADPAAPNYSRSGSIGDPRAATPEKGAALLEAILADAMEAVTIWRLSITKS